MKEFALVLYANEVSETRERARVCAAYVCVCVTEHKQQEEVESKKQVRNSIAQKQ